MLADGGWAMMAPVIIAAVCSSHTIENSCFLENLAHFCHVNCFAIKPPIGLDSGLTLGRKHYIMIAP